MPGAKDAINLLREKGHEIIIHTCNSPEWAKRVLDNNDIRYDYIWGDDSDRDHGYKPVAALYVDDRGFRFRHWNTDIHEILRILENE